MPDMELQDLKFILLGFGLALVWSFFDVTPFLPLGVEMLALYHNNLWRWCFAFL